MNTKLPKLISNEVGNRVSAAESNPQDQVKLLELVAARLVRRAHQIELQEAERAEQALFDRFTAEFEHEGV